MTWYSIETAPKDGTDILLFLPGHKQKISIGRYILSERYEHGVLEHRYERWHVGAYIFGDDCPTPTHWMPLPSGPEEKGKNG